MEIQDLLRFNIKGLEFPYIVYTNTSSFQDAWNLRFLERVTK